MDSRQRHSGMTGGVGHVSPTRGITAYGDVSSRQGLPGSRTPWMDPPSKAGRKAD